MRETVSSPEFETQTLPSPTATSSGTEPTSIVARTSLVAGSILETDPRFALISALTTQSDPSPEAMPMGSAPTSTVASISAGCGPVGPVEAVEPAEALAPLDPSPPPSLEHPASSTRTPASASVVRRGAPLSIVMRYVLRRSPGRGSVPPGQETATPDASPAPILGPMTEAEGARALFKQVADRVDERLFGVREPLGLVMVGILTGNHVLIDDVPGVGKTTLVRILSTLLGLRFQRVQFTPDLMPSDITGTSVLNLKTNDFEFRPGPLFTQVLLADEINRATPKTQAALLEAMQERQVTVDGQTHPLPDPFFVLATQNPIELEGTFPLPEAQLDRFLLRVKLGYPDEREELRILQTQPSERTLPQEPLADRPPLPELRDAIASIGLEQPVRAYVVALARATRDHPELSVGASPRAVEQMGDAARAFAMLDGRDYVLPDDVKRLAEPVFGHRLVPTTDARIRDRDADEILREILRSVPVPTELDT